MKNIKKALILLAIILGIGAMITAYLSITATPEPQEPITTPSEYDSNEVNVNPEKY